jgi:hypothetical protein
LNIFREERELYREKIYILKRELKQRNVKSSYFTMIEYYSLMIEIKKKTLGSLPLNLSRKTVILRIIGILLTLSFIIGMIIFLATFTVYYSDEEMKYWRNAFLMSFVTDLIFIQMFKIFTFIIMLVVTQKMCRSKAGHQTRIKIMNFLNLRFY